MLEARSTETEQGRDETVSSIMKWIILSEKRSRKESSSVNYTAIVN